MGRRKKNDLPDCDATVQREGWTSIQRIHFHDEGQCTRKGREPMHNADHPGKTFRFCAVHARRAREGMVGADGRTVEPNSRKEIAKYWSEGQRAVGMHPGVWSDGDAPAPPELTAGQLHLLRRSAKNADVSSGGNFLLGPKQRADARKLKGMGLGDYYKDENGKMRFNATRGGVFLVADEEERVA